MKHHDIVAGTTGEFVGQVGSVVSTHTYPEAGQFASVRFREGSIWLSTSRDLRPATPSEVAAYKMRNQATAA